MSIPVTGVGVGRGDGAGVGDTDGVGCGDGDATGVGDGTGLIEGDGIGVGTGTGPLPKIAAFILSTSTPGSFPSLPLPLNGLSGFNR